MICIPIFIISLLTCCVDFAVHYRANGQSTEDSNGAIEMENTCYSRNTERMAIESITHIIESMMQTLTNISDGMELLRHNINKQDRRLSLLEEKPQPGKLILNEETNFQSYLTEKQ